MLQAWTMELAQMVREAFEAPVLEDASGSVSRSQRDRDFLETVARYRELPGTRPAHPKKPIRVAE